MAKADWVREARRYNGNLVVWIAQGSDPGLRAANSNGVCHAMTVSWITNDTLSRKERSTFVNSFRRYDDNNRLQSDGHVPQHFLRDQATYATNLAAYNSLVSSAQTLLASYRGRQRPTWVTQRLRRQRDAIRSFQESVYSGLNINRIPIAGPAQLMTKMARTGAYYMFSMFRNGGGGGHVVGFELRNVRISDNYPELYEYFDANLGLFAFSKKADAVGFFVNSVWPTVYRNSYNGGSFKLVEIVLNSPDEGFEADLGDELYEDLEEINRQVQANQPTGAFWRVWETSLSSGATCWRCGLVHGEWRSVVLHWHRCATCSAVYCPSCGYNLPRFIWRSRDRRCTLNNCGGRTALV